MNPCETDEPRPTPCPACGEPADTDVDTGLLRCVGGHFFEDGADGTCPKCGATARTLFRESQGRDVTTMVCDWWQCRHAWDVRETDAEFAERIEATHAAE